MNNYTDFQMAVEFICKIKARFGASKKIYKDFLSILQRMFANIISVYIQKEFALISLSSIYIHIDTGFQTAAASHDSHVIKDVKNKIRTLFKDHTDLLQVCHYSISCLT